ncbi:MAG: YncE family protein [Nevskia sp.]|nr:YncE family protein [Nevskia sp.]
MRLKNTFAVAFGLVSGLIFADTGVEHYAVGKLFSVKGDLGWDYLTADPDTQRLYISHGDHVDVLDASSGKSVGVIGDTPGVHGIAIARDLKRGFISSGKSNSVKVFELVSGKVVANIATGENPDAIVYEPTSRHVFAFNGRGQSISVIDTEKNSVIETIPVGGKPEFARVDDHAHIFFNVEDTSELAVIDATTSKIAARWPLKPCKEPSGLALDVIHRRLFSVCDNRLMTVVDADSGRLVTTLPIGDGADGVEFDPKQQDAFSANGDGTLTIVHEATPDAYSVVQTLATQRGARTIALDASTGELYLPTAEMGPKPPATAAFPAPRPAIVPDTFRVLVVSKTRP